MMAQMKVSVGKSRSGGMGNGNLHCTVNQRKMVGDSDEEVLRNTVYGRSVEIEARCVDM